MRWEIKWIHHAGKISDILPSTCQKLLKSVEICVRSDKNKSAVFLRHGIFSHNAEPIRNAVTRGKSQLPRQIAVRCRLAACWEWKANFRRHGRSTQRNATFRKAPHCNATRVSTSGRLYSTPGFGVLWRQPRGPQLQSIQICVICVNCRMLISKQKYKAFFLQFCNFQLNCFHQNTTYYKFTMFQLSRHSHYTHARQTGNSHKVST